MRANIKNFLAKLTAFDFNNIRIMAVYIDKIINIIITIASIIKYAKNLGYNAIKSCNYSKNRKIALNAKR